MVTPLSPESTIELAKALAAGGINGIEITLRNKVALESIRAVKDADLGIQLGVGTLTCAEHVEQIADIGVDFAVSPGVTPKILDAAQETGLKLLPGVCNPSDILLGMEYGLDFFKLFPATAVNGIPLLKSLYGPFPDLKFCPTGGVTPGNIGDFLSLPNVVCCGGSWMVSNDLVANSEWQKITDICSEAVELISEFE